ncbi:ABC transporter substrate-binding protein [Paenibacillus sp. PDC88]|uniref:ABC transporter substrate-binding protein n=1 Tax=Paenibacillus sp. PDC88 TaxID=1884375 RepID=UPI000897E9A7|nr:ABC transporter substrate-binding protein [Paenibacillus sp. PDC88]SDX18263.1 peptide/nickel transport system substrate-binding protein [Paenibacillus sp. PDC88]
MFTKKMNKLLSSAVLSSLLVLTACGGGGGGETATDAGGAGSSTTGQKVLNIGLKADPPSLDPMSSSSLYDRQVQNSIYDKLFDVNADGEVVPMLVSEYTVSEDGLTYTLTLHDGITFQDGSEFNAEAVKFNLERYKQEGSKRISELNPIDTVEATDELTVVITLKEPFAPFLSVLSDRSGMMVSPAAVEKHGDNYVKNPVGTGPYAFVEQVSGDHVTLKKNENYWKNEVKIDEVNYKVFTNTSAAVQNLRSGVVDIIDEIPVKEIPTVESDPNLTVVAQANMGFQGIHLNNTVGDLQNKYLRQAVDLALDREAIVKVLFDGYGAPAHTPFAPGSLAYNEEQDKSPAVDAAKVQELLEKGGKPDGFSFKMQISTTTENEQFGAVIQNMLKTHKINVELEKVEYGTMLENGDSGNFEAMQLGWSGRIDPDQNVYDFLVTGMPNNQGRISEPELDEVLIAARAEQDTAKRAELYQQAMDIVHENGSYVYIYHNYDKFGVSNKVQGFTYIPDGIIRTANLDIQ